MKPHSARGLRKPFSYIFGQKAKVRSRKMFGRETKLSSDLVRHVRPTNPYFSVLLHIKNQAGHCSSPHGIFVNMITQSPPPRKLDIVFHSSSEKVGLQMDYLVETYLLFTCVEVQEKMMIGEEWRRIVRLLCKQGCAH